MRTLIYGFLLALLNIGSMAVAQDARIEAQLKESAPDVIPLQQALGKKVLDEAMATGKYAYAGNFKCRLCHREFFVGRKQDPHDHTLAKVIKAGHAKNSKCLGCHSTGYGVKGGFKSPILTPQLANVQCEGCHGPGSEHIRKNAKGGLLAGSDRPEVLKRMCYACHDARWNRSYHNFQKAYDSYKSAKPGEEVQEVQSTHRK